MTKSSANLKKVLKGLVTKEQAKSLKLKYIKPIGVSMDSRKLNSGDLFVAYPGLTVDGRQFISNAIDTGVCAIVAEEKNIKQFVNEFSVLQDDNQQVIAYEAQAIKIIPVPNLADKVSRIAGKFYGSPTKKMSLVGVTGTNGKTSVCYLLAQALELMKKPTVMLSTLGNGTVSELEKTENTTSDPITIQQKAAEYLAQSYHHLCMEVSSHGLEQSRVAGLKYKVAVFTNLSLDHLDYHGDMETYFQAKRELFIRKELKFAVINADDEYGMRLLNDPEIKAKKIAFSRQSDVACENVDHWVISSNEQFSLQGISAELNTPWGTGRINSRLLGDFNLSNILAVASVLGALTGDIHKWIIALNAAKAVTGRMQHFSTLNKPSVVVDYAHTPDALEKALKTLRHHCVGNLWCIFGCGGDRDTSKRAIMGKTAEANSDQLVLTDDNPRTESPEQIINMIREGIEDSQVPYIAERKAAISYAMKAADDNDMILMAGKGHEDYQEINGVKHHCSDIEMVEALMGETL